MLTEKNKNAFTIYIQPKVHFGKVVWFRFSFNLTFRKKNFLFNKKILLKHKIFVGMIDPKKILRFLFRLYFFY